MRAVILAGGDGTRLWPLSRASHPKQFHAFNNDQTMFQHTIARLSKLPVESSIIICNEEHRFFVADQLRAMDQLGSIILEPIGRNTAPAIALAALSVLEDDPLLLILAADHDVADQVAFVEAVNEGISAAESGNLITFGITPTEPHTGYGYIKAGSRAGSGFVVSSFKEKPDLSTAKKYLKHGGYYWNSGMFLFRASRYLQELAFFRPDIYKCCVEAFEDVKVDLDFLRVNADKFALCPEDSIDYAVMEQTKDAIVVPMDAGWSDVGSWSSLWALTDKDSAGNVAFGDALLHETKNSYIRSEDKLVATLGVSDLVVVSTKDAVMVAHKDNVEDTKIISKQLKSDSRDEWDLHREVYRPWGKYDSIDSGAGFQVKRLTVSPGAKLSVQKHNYRAEHWVVVAGLARVTKGETTFTLRPNESTVIPTGVIHALENPGDQPLVLIEVQTGSYLGEDDIERFEDRYGRV